MEYMVSASFRAQDLVEIRIHAQEEGARMRALRAQGIINEVYLSSDLLHAWIMLHGESQDDVQKVLESLPLYPYMEVTITKVSRV
jgi:muconolactone delta-isomerase